MILIKITNMIKFQKNIYKLIAEWVVVRNHPYKTLFVNEITLILFFMAFLNNYYASILRKAFNVKIIILIYNNTVLFIQHLWLQWF